MNNEKINYGIIIECKECRRIAGKNVSLPLFIKVKIGCADCRKNPVEWYFVW